MVEFDSVDSVEKCLEVQMNEPFASILKFRSPFFKFASEDHSQQDEVKMDHPGQTVNMELEALAKASKLDTVKMP